MNNLPWRLALLYFCYTLSLPAFCNIESFANQLLQAYEQDEMMPRLSQTASIDMAMAYQIQTEFVKGLLKQDKIAGFKAGFTSEEVQTNTGFNRPIFGVLLQSGNLSHQPSISLKRFKNLLVETELGFITNRPIKNTINSIVELKSVIEKIVPVIELPDFRFETREVNEIDLVTSNAASSCFIVNDSVNWYAKDINNLSMSMLHNGKIVIEGQGVDAFGDQWEALRWLVNTVIAHGWEIEKGSLLITGAVGNILPAEPGHYRAQFIDGVTIEFWLNS